MTTSVELKTRIDELPESDSRRWRAYHVFYGGSPLVILSECLVPLAEKLVDYRLVTEFFYINYWLEGSHVRLRVRIRDGVDVIEVDDAVLGDVNGYLADHPSLHPMSELLDNDFYNQLFAGEFTEAQRPEYFTENGDPFLAQNNSIEIRDYVPEWGRYGGESGMRISEWFFVRSTAQVIELMKLGNLGVRTILLGIATQMTALTAVCMLRDLEIVKDFFIDYHHRWADGYDTNPAYGTQEGRQEHSTTTRAIRQLVVPHLLSFARGNLTELPPLLRNWVEVCVAAREAIDLAYEEGPMYFEYSDGYRAARSPHEAAWSLCHSFIHMTNNRMMVSVADEAFIAYQIVAALKPDESHGH